METTDAEWINEKVPSPSDLPEAPGSIHIDSYLNGFHVGWTKRLSDPNIGKELLTVKAFIANLTENGFKPSWNEDTNNKVGVSAKSTPAELCPKCGSSLVKAKTKNGREFTKCSTNRWNRETNQAEGCDYVKWG